MTPLPASETLDLLERIHSGDEWQQQKQFDGQTQWVMGHIVQLPHDLQHRETLMDPQSAVTLIYNLWQGMAKTDLFSDGTHSCYSTVMRNKIFAH